MRRLIIIHACVCCEIVSDHQCGSVPQTTKIRPAFNSLTFNFRKLLNAPPYVSNLSIHRDLRIKTVQDEALLYYKRFHISSRDMGTKFSKPMSTYQSLEYSNFRTTHMSQIVPNSTNAYGIIFYPFRTSKTNNKITIFEIYSNNTLLNFVLHTALFVLHEVCRTKHNFRDCIYGK
ncbi:Uncharacterized protein FWK35_00015966, partial [Aphis craccivora]